MTAFPLFDSIFQAASRDANGSATRIPSRLTVLAEQLIRSALTDLAEIESFDRVANLSVSMEQGESRITTHTNDLGEFIFDLVPHGIWNLTVVFSDRQFVVHAVSNDERRL